MHYKDHDQKSPSEVEGTLSPYEGAREHLVFVFADFFASQKYS